MYLFSAGDCKHTASCKMRDQISVCHTCTCTGQKACIDDTANREPFLAFWMLRWHQKVQVVIFPSAPRFPLCSIPDLKQKIIIYYYKYYKYKYLCIIIARYLLSLGYLTLLGSLTIPRGLAYRMSHDCMTGKREKNLRFMR